jgi:hypothetical protein
MTLTTGTKKSVNPFFMTGNPPKQGYFVYLPLKNKPQALVMHLNNIISKIKGNTN